MNASEALEKLLVSYSAYYDVKRDDVTPPFVAEAEFHSCQEQYFLVKSAKLSEADSHEYVFFAIADEVTLEYAQSLADIAWTEGLSRVDPVPNHHSSDIVLVILAERIAPDAVAFLKKLHRYKGYMLTFRGWSHFRVIALETSSDKLVYNRMGQILKKLFSNIKNS